MSTSTSTKAARAIVQRTRGLGHGPITRLMGPSDLGQTLKPFVFLDIFDAGAANIGAMSAMPLHPHSGIATVTVITEGHLRFDDPAIGSGVIGYGGVEWMRAGGGVWHGKEMSPGDAARIQGFQLWLALPPEFENSVPESCYLEAATRRAPAPRWSSSAITKADKAHCRRRQASTTCWSRCDPASRGPIARRRATASDGWRSPRARCMPTVRSTPAKWSSSNTAKPRSRLQHRAMTMPCSSSVRRCRIRIRCIWAITRSTHPRRR
jgi:hypothetical protein